MNTNWQQVTQRIPAPEQYDNGIDPAELSRGEYRAIRYSIHRNRGLSMQAASDQADADLRGWQPMAVAL